jgi:uncharacterized phage-associated protein
MGLNNWEDREDAMEIEQKKQYTPLALVNTFIDRYGREDGISHMKLQKLCYYAYGWWIAKHHEPLLTDAPEVWRYGPVFGTLYQALRGFGGRPIREPLQDLLSPSVASVPRIMDDDVVAFVDAIWGAYGRYTDIELSEMTHKTGSPWRIEAERHDYRVPKHYKIPDEVIKEYFTSDSPIRELEVL